MAESGRTTLNRISRTGRDGKNTAESGNAARSKKEIKYKIKTIPFVDGSIGT